MSRKFNGNHDTGSSSANPIVMAGLNLVLSYENAAIDRLEKRISETVVPEVKEKLKGHLQNTKEQQHRLRQRIEAIGGDSCNLLLRRANYLYQNLHQH